MRPKPLSCVFRPLRREHIEIQHRFVTDHFAPVFDIRRDHQKPARPKILHLVTDMTLPYGRVLHDYLG